MKRVVIPAMMIAGSMFTAGAAHAAAATGDLAVSMTITAFCEVKTGGSLTFTPSGAWWNGNVDNTGSFNVQCTNGTSYQIGLDDGLHASGGVRRLNNGTAFLNYQLFTDSYGGTAWGNTPGTDTKASQTGNGSSQLHNVYGRVPSGQTAPAAGTYTDTVTITVTY